AFFSHATPPTAIYTLSLHDALPISGATEIVVSDSHGNGESLLVEEFPKDVRIVRSWPRHGSMMAGLDASFDGALFVGYHASTTRSEEHTSELQSRFDLVCRLLLEKK